MIPFVLAGLAVLLAWVAPGLMARQKGFRRAPRSALVAWQAVSLGGILAALAAAPAAVPLLLDGDSPAAAPRLVVLAVLVSAAGAGPAAVRRAPTSAPGCGGCAPTTAQLVDIVAQHDERMRILQHPTPTAYCIPGRQSRVVLSQGVLDALPADQLEAVVAHEDAHLRGRHDLLLEFFTVVHRGRAGAAAVTRRRSARCACSSRRWPTGPRCAAAARSRPPAP